METDVAKLDDKRLMALADGELDAKETAAVQKLVDASPQAQAKLDSLERVGDVMREYCDHALESKSELLGSMWWRLEDKLDEPAKSEPESTGLWAWLFARRSHLVTGVIGVLAGALIVMATRQSAVHTREVVYVPQPAGGVADVVAAVAEGDVVEELEVVGGTGTVMQIPSENKNGNDTTVIWVTLSDSEGPI